jgi:beta-RFAP synthase
LKFRIAKGTRMIRVVTGSRLHFGLLGLAPPPGGPAARSFGGCGLMVREPAVGVSVRPAGDWHADGPLAARALDFARRFATTLPPDALAPQRVTVETCPPEHAGLGVGTQLGLAAALALNRAAGLPDLEVTDLARRVGRGARSAVGVHGFARGGFLVEGGQRTPGELAPLVAHAAFPEAWRVVLLRPPGDGPWHGERERAAFAALPAEPALTDRLCRLALLGLLPALAEADLPAFAAALGEYNARSGELFRPAQGGVYAGPAVAALVDWLHGQGVRGAGQSSWGQTVFAVAGDADRAAALAGAARHRWGDRVAVLVTAARDGPAISQ